MHHSVSRGGSALNLEKKERYREGASLAGGMGQPTQEGLIPLRMGQLSEKANRALLAGRMRKLTQEGALPVRTCLKRKEGGDCFEKQIVLYWQERWKFSHRRDGPTAYVLKKRAEGGGGDTCRLCPAVKV